MLVAFAVIFKRHGINFRNLFRTKCIRFFNNNHGRTGVKLLHTFITGEGEMLIQ